MMRTTTLNYSPQKPEEEEKKSQDTFRKRESARWFLKALSWVIMRNKMIPSTLYFGYTKLRMLEKQNLTIEDDETIIPKHRSR